MSPRSVSVSREAGEPVGTIGTMMVVTKRRTTTWYGEGGWDYNMWMAGDANGNIGTGFQGTYGWQTEMVNTADNPMVFAEFGHNRVSSPGPIQNRIDRGISKEWHMMSMTWTKPSTGVKGDMDCDGDVDFDDINDFVLGLNSPADYESMYGIPPSVKGDIDMDGDQDFDDISGFVGILSGGGDPEPHMGLKYYWDGELVYESDSLNEAVLSGSTHELLIGARAHGSRTGGEDDFEGDGFIGQLDEVAIFSEELPASFHAEAFMLGSNGALASVLEPATWLLAVVAALGAVLSRRWFFVPTR